jgi:hypothetical protein
VNLKIDPRFKLGGKPVFKLLTLDLFLARQKCGSQEISASIFYAPDDVGGLALVQARRIGDGRDPLAYLGRVGFVVLELNPLGLFMCEQRL